jgi:hypothetical protein
MFAASMNKSRKLSGIKMLNNVAVLNIMHIGQLMILLTGIG